MISQEIRNILVKRNLKIDEVLEWKNFNHKTVFSSQIFWVLSHGRFSCQQQYKRKFAFVKNKLGPNWRIFRSNWEWTY